MPKYNSSNNLPIEDMSIHMLIEEISKFTCSAVSQESDSLGVAIGYRSILFFLGQNDGVTQLELSRLTGLKPPTVSVSLQKMENEGLVSRENDKDDLRKTIVTLTEKGRDICDKIAIVYDDCNKVITTALSPEELETLKAILVKISKNISDSKEG